jgi:hypothetical protein
MSTPPAVTFHHVTARIDPHRGRKTSCFQLDYRLVGIAPRAVDNTAR